MLVINVRILRHFGSAEVFLQLGVYVLVPKAGATFALTRFRSWMLFLVAVQKLGDFGFKVRSHNIDTRSGSSVTLEFTALVRYKRGQAVNEGVRRLSACNIVMNQSAVEARIQDPAGVMTVRPAA